MTLKMK